MLTCSKDVPTHYFERLSKNPPSPKKMERSAPQHVCLHMRDDFVAIPSSQPITKVF
jgi:hypothetical protein